MRRKNSIALAVVAAAIATARPARAQPQDVPVEISATQPGSHINVRGAGLEFPCGERCVVVLPQHQYRIDIRDPDGHASATAVNILRPTSLTVSPANYRDKVSGVGLFVGGLAGVAAGAVVLFLAAHDHAMFVSGGLLQLPRPACVEVVRRRHHPGRRPRTRYDRDDRMADERPRPHPDETAGCAASLGGTATSRMRHVAQPQCGFLG